MCSNTASYVMMWSREGTPSAESMSLPFSGKIPAQSSAVFSTFYTAAEDLRLNHANYCTSLSVATVLCLGVLDFTAFFGFH